MSNKLVVKTEIREFKSEFIWKIWKIRRWNLLKIVKSPVVEMFDEKSDKSFSYQAVIDSWKEIRVEGNDVSGFRISEINEDGRYPIRDLEKAMEWDWRYRNEIVLHFEVFFRFCI